MCKLVMEIHPNLDRRAPVCCEAKEGLFKEWGSNDEGDPLDLAEVTF